MATEKIDIRMFLTDLVRLGLLWPGPAGFGSPVSELVSTCFRIGVSTFVDRIYGDYTGESHEFRINGAGLKLIWEMDRKDRRLKVSLVGDQKDNYPEFSAEVRELIKERGYQR